MDAWGARYRRVSVVDVLFSGLVPESNAHFLVGSKGTSLAHAGFQSLNWCAPSNSNR